jgi:HSP20 family protein
MAKTKELKGEVVPRTARDLTPFEEMDRMFDHLFEGGFLRPFEWRWPDLAGFRHLEERLPKIDIVDREHELLVRAEIPGVKKDQLEITLVGDQLTIKGETREQTEEKGEIYRAEIRRGSFQRSVRLPEAVLGEKAKAHFEDGLLEVTIPKAHTSPRHSVEIE